METNNKTIDLSGLVDDSAEGMIVVVLPGVTVLHGVGSIHLIGEKDKRLSDPIYLDGDGCAWREIG